MIPKILYHGTSRGRYEVGIKQQGLCGDMPRYMAVDYSHFGYIFLTDSVNDAAFYSLLTLEFDNQIPKFKIINEIVGNQGIILFINTSNLEDIEPDPERERMVKFYERWGVLEEVRQMGLCANWYRVLGHIPTKYIHPYKDVPYNKQHPIFLKIMKETVKNR